MSTDLVLADFGSNTPLDEIGPRDMVRVLVADDRAHLCPNEGCRAPMSKYETREKHQASIKYTCGSSAIMRTFFDRTLRLIQFDSDLSTTCLQQQLKHAKTQAQDKERSEP